MALQGRYMHEATKHIPLIGDGDTGYGNALNVKRTVRGYAAAGFAGGGWLVVGGGGGQVGARWGGGAGGGIRELQYTCKVGQGAKAGCCRLLALAPSLRADNRAHFPPSGRVWCRHPD
jgi:hypothetical protein